jgi:hypothetical protein
MSLILSGSNGLSDVDGSAATPAIRGTDANTGMFFPAADTIAFATAGTEDFRIGSAGELGIQGANLPPLWSAIANSVEGLTGSVQLSNASSFGRFINTNGYQRLPGGLYLQWGVFTTTASNQNQSVTFPITFPNACWLVVNTINSNGGNVQQLQNIQTTSTTGFTTAGFNQSGTKTWGWISLGF